MPEHINIRFYDSLNDFLPVSNRKTGIDYESKESRSVKDLVESIGVPHTEIDLMIVNGESVDFNYLVKDGDHISVYPEFMSLDISSLKHCQPKTPEPSRFVLDVHLGRLAAYLRMTGLDTIYRNNYDDESLARLSAEEHRILLTCDRQLLMRKQITYGYFVRSRQPQKQLMEILSRYDLFRKLHPFSRCIHCNGSMQAVNKQEIEDRLLDKTRKYYNEFYQCKSCNKIYWKGSHYRKMKNMIERISINTHVTPVTG